MLYPRGSVVTSGWPRAACSESCVMWFPCCCAAWSPERPFSHLPCISFLPAGIPWCLPCIDSLSGRCARQLIKVLPGPLQSPTSFLSCEPVCCWPLWMLRYQACWLVVLPHSFPVGIFTAVDMLLLAWVLHPLFQNKWGVSSTEPWVFHTRAKEEEGWHPRQEHHRLCNLVIFQEGFYSIFILLQDLNPSSDALDGVFEQLSFHCSSQRHSPQLSRIYHLSHYFLFLKTHVILYTCSCEHMWSFMMLFFCICVIFCAHSRVYLAGLQIMRVKVIFYSYSVSTDPRKTLNINTVVF